MKVRLAEYDPETVASEAVALVRAHADRIATLAGVGIVSTGGTLSRLHEMAALVTRYAQTGAAPGFPSQIVDYLTIVAGALFSTAHPAEYLAADWEPRRNEPALPIDVVLRAAYARERLSKTRGTVPIGWLAPLAGVDVQTIRTYSARGDLTVTNGDTSCAEARKWLAARGVPGF